MLMMMTMTAPLMGAQITGRVTLSFQIPSSAVMISPYSRNRYRPPANRRIDDNRSSVVIYVKSHNLLSPAAGSTPAVVDQRNISILPHVTVAEVGNSVRFLNSDNVYHNIFSLSKAKRFNLGRYPNGQSRQITFDKVGIVELFCDIHSDMNGIIVVVPNEHYATLDADGNYSITDLPVGTYTIAAWRENREEQLITVEISSPDDAIIINFEL